MWDILPVIKICVVSSVYTKTYVEIQKFSFFYSSEKTDCVWPFAFITAVIEKLGRIVYSLPV